MTGRTEQTILTDPVPCSEVRGAVKDTLGNPGNYTVLESDDTKMKAACNVKHNVHVNVSGAILQRTNRVTLVSKGKGCETRVGSNFSGWEHDDKGDFRKRVDEFLAKPKASIRSEPAKPAAPTK